MVFSNHYLLINVANNKAPAEPAHSKSTCGALFSQPLCTAFCEAVELNSVIESR